ncbi:7166_t:CDS:2 [Dentiscutata erythropus]|uniref:7166_t:CDS:1 n=1 Tax=Dentiscutata erythropus TaxID=1348616 RepID=A0A9N8W540_9GLOM|nr:7166_t:CDS:2 [Dentiscutata erythropus]
MYQGQLILSEILDKKIQNRIMSKAKQESLKTLLTIQNYQNVDNCNKLQNIMGGDICTDPKEQELFLPALNNYHNKFRSGSLPLIYDGSSNGRPQISRLNTYPQIPNYQPSVTSSEYQPFNIEIPSDNNMPNFGIPGIQVAYENSKNRSESNNLGDGLDIHNLINGSNICNLDCENSSENSGIGSEDYNSFDNNEFDVYKSRIGFINYNLGFTFEGYDFGVRPVFNILQIMQLFIV